MKTFKYYFIFTLVLLPAVASADLATDSGLEAAAGPTNLIKERNLNVLIAGIINSLLTLLGSLFIVLIIYGGFKWMTSGGNTEKVSEAKTTIKNSVIGVAIIVLSYVIVRAVLGILERSTMGSSPSMGGEG